MTKNVFIAAVIVSVGMFLCPLNAQNVSKNISVSEFSSIKLESVGSIVFTQSSAYSCRIEGPKEYVDKSRVTVKNGKLTISYKAKNVKRGKKLTFYIAAPDLTKVELDGVGNFIANETLELGKVDFELDGVGNCTVKDLRCDEVSAQVDGVGNMSLHLDCRTLKAEVDGIGNITLSGKADKAYLKRGGIGSIRHKNLKCREINKGK